MFIHLSATQVFQIKVWFFPNIVSLLLLKENHFWPWSNIIFRVHIYSHFWNKVYLELWGTVFSIHFWTLLAGILWNGLPKWHSGKGSAYQCRRRRRYGFDPCIRKIPWRRKCILACILVLPVFLLGKSHEQRSLAGCSP